jgi:ABC-type Zn uptake system ZnuABC Zn-binding protein ZnuA
LIESAGAQDKVVYVSSGIEFLGAGAEEHEDEPQGGEHQHTPNNVDPHTWTDPNNILVWIHNIEENLSAADPTNSAAYAANAGAFNAEIKELDAWVREQTAQIAPEDRVLVSDHSLFSYFADEYGFEQVGALIPGYSTLAEPSAQELAEIEDAISQLDVKAVFVGNTVNPALAERTAADKGVALVYLYTGSLSEPGGEAETYLDYIRYNVSAIVDALK